MFLSTTSPGSFSAEAGGTGAGWLAVFVTVKVKPELEAEFIEATLENCRESGKEEHVAQFQLSQRAGTPSTFTMLEVFTDPDAGPAAHKATPHYAAWRDAVQPMMAEPRSSVKMKVLVLGAKTR